MRSLFRVWAALLPFALPVVADAPEPMVVGAYVGPSEVSTLEVYRDGDRFLVPLNEFVAIAGCRVEAVGETTRVRTPLGPVDLPASEMRTIDGVVHISDDFIEGGLATPVAFDAGEYALRLAPPWGPTSNAPVATSASLTPEVGPPGFSLGTLYQDLFYGSYGAYDSVRSSTMMAGSLQGGYWRLRYDDNFDGDQRLTDYAWRRTSGNHMLLAGQQTIFLHPLMRGFELTGAQYAWTNQPLDIFPRARDARELLPRRVRPATAFNGTAAPGSVVQLKIDGVITDRQVVGLNGAYEFPDISLPARQLSQVEVVLFDRQSPGVPIVLQQASTSASEFLLRDGAVVHMGGAGRYGNLANTMLGTDAREGPAGFYQWRQGLSERFTVEAGVEYVEGLVGQVGFVSMPARRFVLALGLGGSNGKVGYNIDLDGRGRRWRWLVSSRHLPADYYDDASEEYYDHRTEGWYSPTRRLDLGLVARSRLDSLGEVDFVLPALGWRPHRNLLLNARPNIDGEYRLDGSLRMTRRDRIVVSSEEETIFDYSHLFSNDHRLSLVAADGGERPERRSVIFSRLLAPGRRTAWSVGALESDGEPGYLAGGSLFLIPGVALRGYYESVPVSGFISPSAGANFEFGLTVDMTLAGRRFMPGNSTSVHAERGGIAGRVIVENAAEGAKYRLEGLTILVDGRATGRTDPAGNFFIGDLDSGIHVVELDVEELPFELVPRRTSIAAEVARGASTRVDFGVRPEYGVAGRVVNSGGSGVFGVRIELRDRTGQRVGRTVTDRFGLYRLDAVPVGEYELGISEEQFAGQDIELPSRRVRIVDRFLFGNDLQIEGTDPFSPQK